MLCRACPVAIHETLTKKKHWQKGKVAQSKQQLKYTNIENTLQQNIPNELLM